MAEERNLKLFKGTRKIRELPSVILGSDGIRGVQQTLFEIITNSIDRFKAGYGNKIIITRHSDDSYTIQDFADGLPCLWNEKERLYNWDIALNKLYGGDNYALTQKELDQKDLDGKLGNYGLGLASSQMSSEYMNVIVRKQNEKYILKFKEGRPLDKNTLQFVKEDNDEPFTKEEGEKVLRIEKNTDNYTGTIINYKPDKRVFTDTNIDFEWIKKKLNTQATVCKGIKLIFIDEKNDKNVEYKYDSIEDYINKNIVDTTNDISNIIHFYNRCDNCQDTDGKLIYKMDYDLTFKFNNKVQKQEYYHNSSELTELTYNVTTEALKKGLTKAIHEYISNNKLYKGKEKIKFDDISDSLIAVLISRSTKTSYANQTKLSIDNQFIRKFISDKVYENMLLYLNENKLEADKIVNQILINMRANDNAQKARQNLKKKLESAMKPKVKIEGLTNCDFKNSELDERFLLVVEGLSPKETVVESYDNRTMGALGLRGRFISCLKKSVTEVLNNIPAYTFIQALGCGIEIPYEERKSFKDIKTFSHELLKYGNIGILTDADCWGSGIRLALLTFIYKYLPTLLKENRVFIIISPRYEIKLKDGNIDYVYNDREKEEYMKTVDKSTIAHIGIVKGIGEINADDFWNKVLCPEVRDKTFIQVTCDNIDEILISKTFEDFMGKNTEPRKEFANKYINNINLSEIN